MNFKIIHIEYLTFKLPFSGFFFALLSWDSFFHKFYPFPEHWNGGSEITPVTAVLQYIWIQNIPTEAKATHLKIRTHKGTYAKGEREREERKGFGGIMMPYSFPISIFQIVPLFVTPGGFYTLRQCTIVRWLRGMPSFCFWTSGA